MAGIRGCISGWQQVASVAGISGISISGWHQWQGRHTWYTSVVVCGVPESPALQSPALLLPSRVMAELPLASAPGRSSAAPTTLIALHHHTGCCSTLIALLVICSFNYARCSAPPHNMLPTSTQQTVTVETQCCAAIVHTTLVQRPDEPQVDKAMGSEHTRPCLFHVRIFHYP